MIYLLGILFSRRKLNWRLFGFGSQITDTAWLKDLGVECPSVGAAKPSWKAKKFAYFRPRSIRPVGSLACGLLARSSDTVTADLLVEMPAECLERDDNVDQVYQRKRALYLSYLAGQVHL